MDTRNLLHQNPFVKKKRLTRTAFAKLLQVDRKTLQRWEDRKLLVPGRYPNQRPFYTQQHYEQVLGLDCFKEMINSTGKIQN